MKTKDLFIIYDDVKYRLVFGRECTNHCSFRKADGPYYCERGCYLPKWFTKLQISTPCWLEKVEENRPVKNISKLT